MDEHYRQSVWVFNGGGAIPAAVFSTRELAEAWIEENHLNGMLTRYPVDESLYDWAIKLGFFKPKRADQERSEFIGRFTCASTEHYHYGDEL